MPWPDHVDTGAPTRADRLMVAFAVHWARRIVHADGILHISEIELLMMTFPNDLMFSLGFLDDETALTPACAEAYDAALRELPDVITLEEKLNLVTLFHRTCMADGELHEAERALLLDAGAALKIGAESMHDHLRELRCGGTIVPPIRRGRDFL